MSQHTYRAAPSMDARIHKMVHATVLDTRRELRNTNDGSASKRVTSFTKGHRLCPIAIQLPEDVCLPVEMHTLRLEQPLLQTSTFNTLVPTDPDVAGFSEGMHNTLQLRMHWNAELFKDQPASRQSAIMLDKYLIEMMSKIHESSAGLLGEAMPRVQYMRDCQRLYNMVMHELTRQVSAHCVERGHLLAKLWVRSVEVFNSLMDVFNSHQSKSRDRIARLEEEVRGMRKGSLVTARCAENAVVAVTKGQLDFGPWEQIFYGEFDGNRAKRVLVKIIGE